MAVLTAGGAYLPIGPQYPRERIEVYTGRQLSMYASNSEASEGAHRVPGQNKCKMRKEIFEKIRNYLREGVELKEEDVDKIDENTGLVSIGLNSISFIKAIVAIENGFDIEIGDENLDLNNVKTVKGIIDLIEIGLSSK